MARARVFETATASGSLVGRIHTSTGVVHQALLARPQFSVCAK